MSEQFKRTNESEPLDQPKEMARRTVLQHGVKLAYVVPVVIAAVKAEAASRFPISSAARPLPSSSPGPSVPSFSGPSESMTNEH